MPGTTRQLNNTEILVKVEKLYKTFKLPHEKNSSIKSALINFVHRKGGFEKQRVLSDISFEIKKGEFFGIVGRNGSGKSTLLKLLAGIYTPDKGNIQVHGKLTPFIELGVGFNPELSGRANVFLNGALLGFSRKEMESMYDEIVDFAELERFMDQKLKNYSSGMQVRLAFSIAIKAKSDILLIDEVLAVGDAAFQSKCFDYFYELKKSNTTVIFVSHDQGSLERFCDRAILIDKGRITKSGKVSDVLSDYSAIVMSELAKASKNDSEDVHNTKPDPVYAKIQNVLTKNNAGKNETKFRFRDEIWVEYEIAILRDISNPIMGVTIWQRNVEKAVMATNTIIDGYGETGHFKKGQVVRLQFKLPTILNNGEYYIEPAIANESGTVFYDQKEKATTFFINGGNNPHSLISFSKKLTFEIRETED